MITPRNPPLVVKDENPLILPSSVSVKAACVQMRERRVGAALVTGFNHRLIGIFTGRDAVCMLAQGRSPFATPLSLVMTENPETIGPQETAIDALRAMNAGDCRHVPVVENGSIVGIVGIVSQRYFRGSEPARFDADEKLWEVAG